MCKPIVDGDYLTSKVNDTPRAKCCGECAFRRNDPQNLADLEEWEDEKEQMRKGWLAFYCVHTTDEQGRNQMCAGFWALYGRHQVLPFWEGQPAGCLDD
ncbi:hypothetical protein OIU34_22190 [Pararhizobium sp. BT-229]|uniref:hypothetical protein n=1 Tax=Pararhizobium sp. BT-229 TaxID=2986923 RepID=UPI0021F7A4B7|nr:hypothetical protein [Pararhizobium sp. BT-229]MCV9964604.1 hypothetical protein [Pararhizobium sp. BT-229]